LLLVGAIAALVSPAQAQRQPSASAIAMAKEIIAVKGSAKGYNVVVVSLIERAKGMLLQTNPMLSKDLNQVALKLRKDYAKKAEEPLTDAAKLYASKFTEQELKTILAFYKTPTGKKVIEQEPVIFQQSMQDLDAWSAKVSEDVLNKFRDEMRKRGHNL
jgi:hypothetical protein